MLEFPALFTRNAVGEILFSILNVSLESVQEKRCQDSFRVVQSKLALAVNAYRLDKGMFPENLEQVSPEYIHDVPNVFGGKSIRYTSQTGRIGDMEGFF